MWKIVGPKKYHMFVWLILHEVLPANSLRFQRHLSSSALCTRCHNAEEDLLHCLQDCIASKQLWMELGFDTDPSFFTDNFNSWIHKRLHEEFNSLFMVALWWS